MHIICLECSRALHFVCLSKFDACLSFPALREYLAASFARCEARTPVSVSRLRYRSPKLQCEITGGGEQGSRGGGKKEGGETVDADKNNFILVVITTTGLDCFANEAHHVTNRYYLKN